MTDTAEIRKKNKDKIMELMRSGKKFTKQDISFKTGLSPATCNTLLNVLESEGKVIGEKKQLNDVGRNTAVYNINDGFESILCICFELLSGMRKIFTRIVSPSGKLLYEYIEKPDIINYKKISETVSHALKKFGNITKIIIGTPSIAENGIITLSDVPELENLNLAEKLLKEYEIPVIMENDMHFKAYGYYKLNRISEKIITIMNFPANVLPGTATIYKGTVIKGKNGFAGMAGFMNYDMPREELLKKLNPKECIPFIGKAAAAIISIVNPDEMVFTGNLLDDKSLDKIYKECLKSIPKEFVPEFSFTDNLETFYIMGMYYAAFRIQDKKKSDFENCKN